MKREKIKALKHFHCQNIPKNGRHSEIMFPPQFKTGLKVNFKIIVLLKF